MSNRWQSRQYGKAAFLAFIVGGCAGEAKMMPPPPPPPALAASAAPSAVTPASMPAPPSAATQAPSPALDEKAVLAATGVEKTETGEGVVRATFPRKDIVVAVDGWKLPPFMGLTSWTGFASGKAGASEAMVMGDLVLLADEVNPVMSVLLENGVEVTALHNHFFFDAPNVYFMHIGGEGTVAALGKGVRLAMDKVAEIRKRSPKPPPTFGAAVPPAKSSIDAAKIETTLGVKGAAKDGMIKATMGRQAQASCGCPIGKAMGVNTWAAFGGSDDNAVVDGDFAVTESELQPVLKALRGGGINIVAIHHHMSGESPRILFLHYWGRGKAIDLASTVRKALDLTAWDGKTKSS